ncbi:arrestin domain-containing protein 17-like [Zerene cesonia]|uniref:arrestin domain-containing protein 17-like n=1 Tax=Zerene cesonia TaxID=33412 RepID=UPI0018E58EAF|nr:arrestin domain-containing protein 17-like [Zerene cesonia]XP_038222089.1 arrestin domain-containing protein 17-like [Zerene cesonia]
MGFDEGSIILNSDNGAYYPGQTIHARLVFKQDKVKNFRGIYAKIKGYCEVRWTSRHTRKNANGREETYERVHESHEEYINRKLYLVGGESGEHELPPGDHDFPFDFTLPANCPSSFEGSAGHVRYEIKVVVDRAFKFDQEKKVAVRVIAPVDLNANPYCKEPMEFNFEDTYYCCCMGSGSMETLVKLPLSGYCPGQVIPAEVACSNKGDVEIDTIKLILKKEISYIATTNPDTKHTKSVVAEIKKGPVPANTTRNWNVEMVVPDVDIYNMDTCRFIDIDYVFKVVVSPSGCHNDTEGFKRLIIGNVALVGYQDNVPNPLQDQMPQVNTPLINQSLNASPYPNRNPPYTGSMQNLANPPYPTTNSPYPQNSPYPVASPYPTGPNPPYPAPSPIPGNNSPYPAPSPIPGNNPPYPVTSPILGNNPPYPVTSPIPGNNSPYPAPSPIPGNIPPYPTSSPYPNTNSNNVPCTPQTRPPYPNSQSSTPYPQNPPYPQTSPYPSQGPGLKTGTFGFAVPGMPVRASDNVPNPTSPMSNMNPYATASAPPDTPDK